MQAHTYEYAERDRETSASTWVGRVFFRGGSTARRQPQVRKGASSATGVLSLSGPIIVELCSARRPKVPISFPAEITPGFILFTEAIKLHESDCPPVAPSREYSGGHRARPAPAAPCSMHVRRPPADHRRSGAGPARSPQRRGQRTLFDERCLFLALE